MRPVPAISVVTAAALCGALFGACFAPAAATDAAHHARAGDPAALPPPALAATGRRALADEQRRVAARSDPPRGGCGESPLCSREGDFHHNLHGGTYLVYGGEAPPAPPTSPALLWLALAVPAGVAYRLVIAMIEGRQAHIVLLACASLFLSGLVLIGA